MVSRTNSFAVCSITNALLSDVSYENILLKVLMKI